MQKTKTNFISKEMLSLLKLALFLPDHCDTRAGFCGFEVNMIILGINLCTVESIRRLFTSPGLEALRCGSDQKRPSDQRDARIGLNPHWKGHGPLHYSSGCQTKAGSVKKKQKEKKRERSKDWFRDASPLFIHVHPHRPLPKVLLSYSKSRSSPVGKQIKDGV